MSTYIMPDSGTLRTWGGHSECSYHYDGGLSLQYGAARRCRVNAEQLGALRTALGGRLLAVFGAEESLDAWAREHITRTRIASYLAPALIALGVAERCGNKLRVKVID